MSFHRKKLHEIDQYRTRGDYFARCRGRPPSPKTIVLIISILLILGIGRAAIRHAQQALPTILGKATDVVTTTLGEPLLMDDNGNINAMVMGYGGGTHQGGYLVDSLMVVSYNPQTQAVTMISIPRDLYVNYQNIYFARINALLPFKLNRLRDNQPETFDESFAIAANALKSKAEDISGLSIPYYVGVSFAGFAELIDKVGGLTIDVPEAIHDLQYPDANTKGYEPFHIEAGLQTIDGATALKYARSRRTSSDGSRSFRQQQIVSALVTQIRDQFGGFKPNKREALYQQYRSTVQTNLGVDQLLYAAQWRDQVSHFFSFVFGYECGASYNLMKPACVLYTPPRADFDGQAILLPEGAYAGNVSNYTKTQDFSYLVSHLQGFLIEGARIHVHNGIDKSYAATNRSYRSGKADILASKLVQYGFDVTDIDNAEQVHEQTTVYTYGNTYPETRKALAFFVDSQHVPLSGHTLTLTGEALTLAQSELADMVIVLGNNFINQLNDQTHSIMAH